MAGLRPVILSVIAGLALYLIFLVFSGYEDTLAAIARLGLRDWLFIVGFSLSNYALRFWRWHQYLAAFASK